MNKLKTVCIGLAVSLTSVNSHALTAEQIEKCRNTGNHFVFNDRCIPNNPCNSKSQAVLDSYCVSAFENAEASADLADMVGQSQDANPVCAPVPGEEAVVCTYPGGKKIGIKMKTGGKTTLPNLNNKTKYRLSVLCESMGGKILDERKGCSGVTQDQCALLDKMLNPKGKESVGYTDYVSKESKCEFFINQEN